MTHTAGARRSRNSSTRLDRRTRLAVESLEGRTVPSFLGVQNFPIGGGPLAVAAGDVNNDGRPDLVAPEGPSGVSVLLGNGDGTFQPRRDSAAGSTGGSVVSISLGDFNGDGKLDAATTNAAGAVTVQIGNADGTFGAAKSTAVGTNLRSIAAADLNGDGKLDLAITSFGTDQKNLGTTVSILMGRGDGTFNPPAR